MALLKWNFKFSHRKKVTASLPISYYTLGVVFVLIHTYLSVKHEGDRNYDCDNCGLVIAKLVSVIPFQKCSNTIHSVIVPIIMLFRGKIACGRFKYVPLHQTSHKAVNSLFC